VVAPHRPIVLIVLIVLAVACGRDGADVQALSSPDPQVTAANAVMARRRVRT
jgi:hypothetical protein